jgi:DNA-binding beta-propeller fold protein YncE
MNRFSIPLSFFTLFIACRVFAADGYRVDPAFPQLPPEIKLGAVSGVAIDAAGNILVFNRAEPPILVFSPDGKFLRGIGDKLFTSSHGLRIDADGNLWTTDWMDHRVLKLSPDGKVLQTFGEKNKPGVGADHFNKPTDIAFAANGDVYISDGYGNSRVAQFDKTGKFIREWGTRGKADGQFHLPHAIRIDSKGNVYVGDRENNRIEVFSPEGKFIRKIEGIAPYGLFITKDDVLFIADGRANEVVKMSSDGKVLARWGSKGKTPGKFELPHCVAVGADGAVYVGDINGKRIQKFVQANEEEKK